MVLVQLRLLPLLIRGEGKKSGGTGGREQEEVWISMVHIYTSTDTPV